MIAPLTPGLLLALSLAGGLGAALRFLVDTTLAPRLLGSRARSFPWGIAIVNVSGSLLLGLAVALLGDPGPGGDPWVTVIGMGLLGGYTTLSTAAVDTARLLAGRRFGAALANGLGVTLACVLAAGAGLVLGGLVPISFVG